MAYEKTLTFDGEGKTLEEFELIIENILQSFPFTTKSVNIDDTLTIVTFIDEGKNKDLQKDNKIAIYEEDGKYFIQVKGNIPKQQAEKFWDLLKEGLESKEKKELDKEDRPKKRSKEEIIDIIIHQIEEKGFNIKYAEATDFVENFQQEFERFPLMDEIDSIVAGYIKMLKEEEQTPVEPPSSEEKKAEPKKVAEVEIEEQELSEDFSDDLFTDEAADSTPESSEEQAFKTKLKEYDFLNEAEVSYYLDLLDKVDMEDKRNIIENLEFIEQNIQEIKINLSEEKIIELRKDLITLDKKRIEDTINRLKKEIEKKSQLKGWDLKEVLKNLDFLTRTNRSTLFEMAKDLSEERQKDVVERLKEIEKEFTEVEKDGIELEEWEKAQYRLDLVKLTKENREEKLVELIRDKKEELISAKLQEEIPQLKYEDTEKIVKELLWLTGDEIDERIKKIKNNMSKKLEKKQELFQKSTAGDTCPNCGWPVSSFSKKCPRCGKKLIDWL
ncbi:MAG: hypothetical protein R6U96_11740 [Promethearchaeia archaeon]